MGNLGNTIKNLRKEHHLSQDELGARLNMTRQAISNWENGKSEPSIEMIQKMTDIFETDLNHLIEGIKMPTENQNRQHMILFGLCILTFLIHFVLSLMGKVSLINVIIAPGMGTTICVILYFVFENSFKNNDYSMIAGYDRNKNYNLAVFKRILMNIRLFTFIQVFIINSLYAMIYAVEDEKQVIVSVIFLFLYTISLISVVLVVNLKYKNEIYQSK